MKFESTSFKKPTGADGSISGGMGIVYLGVADDMDVIATRYANPTTNQEEVSVDGDHSFKSGTPKKGFMPFYHDPTNTDTALEHSMNGEGLGSNTLVELTIFYPGKSYAIEALLKSKPELIMLVGDVNCALEKYVQVGDKCDKANISSWTYSKGNKKDGTPQGYNIVITAYNESVLNYGGAVILAS